MTHDTGRFEEKVRHLGDLDDPLSVFEDYFNHLLRIHADSLTVTKLLERATLQFVEDRRYRNDPRYLRLWLAYAQRCKKPEDIYSYLAQQCIASELAGFYEDYAAYLEKKGDLVKAGEVLRAGVDRGAQPKERLLRRFKEFNEKHPIKKIEKAGYSLKIIDNGTISFEEARAKGWRKNGIVLKTKSASKPESLRENAHPLGLTSEGDGFEDCLGPINPDDLTTISIYRDNTADLRELAAKLPIHDETVEEAKPLSLEQILSSNFNNERSRLSLIAEESDNQTQASLLIPHLMALKRAKIIENEAQFKFVSIDEEWISQMKKKYIEKSAFAPIDDEIAFRLKVFESGACGDVRKDKTVASLNLNGHKYFVQKALSTKVLMGFDLSSCFSDQSTEIIIKYDKSSWEAAVLTRLSSSNIIPQLLNVDVFSDLTVFTQTFSSHINLSHVLNSVDLKVDGKVYLYWMRNLVSCIIELLKKGIIHGRIFPEHVLLRFKECFQSDNTTQSVHLVGFSRSLIIEDGSFLGCFNPAVIKDYSPSFSEKHCVWLCDLLGFNLIWKSLPSPSSATLKGCWEKVNERMANLLEMNNVTRDSVIEQLYLILKVMDECLKEESRKSPSLRACLEGVEMFFPPDL